MRELNLADLDDMALGATLLGAGGGGDPYIGRLMVHQAMETYGAIQIVEPSELDPDGLVVTVAGIGAPTVIAEKPPAGPEFVGAARALAKYLGREPVAIMPIEVGGLNTLIPMAAAAEMGLPVIDADSMRRAFPQIEMTTFTLAGITATPMSMADIKGNVVIFSTTSNQVAEKLARATVMELGMSAAMSAYSMTVAEVAKYGIQGSMTYCVDLGRKLSAVQRGERGAFDKFLDFAEGKRVFSGKIIDLDRRTTAGFARGTVVIEHLNDPTRIMRIEIQNEFLIAFEDGKPIITAPDLICILDHENAGPITTETLAFGQRVDVVGLPCAPEWHQPGMLELVGPSAFGYDVPYVPISKFQG
ncbi:MAG: DUF917 family protein [Actinobacteria bacterium]|uniref:Unannotated protein n=1 Tax=freshwater metagenome TaxID=449393 RepID=A0A6J7TTH0_9ZZZZ|nr:DUF917 family protein [Actinomycetota bacterium]MTB15045.1 DUF917 family protein [Actinomycetota bacterium]MTB25136.1 DUF917 family protein [Actinomycetota bacterium]